MSGLPWMIWKNIPRMYNESKMIGANSSGGSSNSKRKPLEVFMYEWMWCIVDGSAFEPSPAAASDAAMQYVFDPLWCRSMEFTDDGRESLTLSNMTVSRYTQSADVFNNSLYERGFCTGSSDKCLPPGVMNATACQGRSSLTCSHTDTILTRTKLKCRQ